MPGRRGINYIPIGNNKVIEVGSGLAASSSYNANGYRGYATDNIQLTATGVGASPVYEEIIATPGQFTVSLSNTPSTGMHTMIFVNGVIVPLTPTPVGGISYSISGNVLTFISPFGGGEQILAYYYT